MPCWPDRYFGDAAHLNGTGAEAFSRELDEALRQAAAGGAVRPLPDRCIRGAVAAGL
jgi:hypothetical protein